MFLLCHAATYFGDENLLTNLRVSSCFVFYVAFCVSVVLRFQCFCFFVPRLSVRTVLSFMAKNAYIPRPEKFAADTDIAVWFRQFELFLQLSAVGAANRLNVLLTYLDLSVFQATDTALNIATATFEEVKTFLLGRYSTRDDYMDRVSFFESRFSQPAGAYAARLSSIMDNFSQNAATLRGEILVAKFIASSQGTLASELRLRRPTALNECVQIANSLATTAPSSSSCMLVSPPLKQGKIKLKTNRKVPATVSTKICFRCGSAKHIASAPDCPARNSECGHCHKVGHWRKVCKSFQSLGCTDNVRVSSITLAAASVSRPTISIVLENSLGRCDCRHRCGGVLPECEGLFCFQLQNGHTFAIGQSHFSQF